MKKIKIKVNGKFKTVLNNSKLSDLLKNLNIPLKKVAIELNQEIIELNNKRGELLQTVIQDNKSLEKDYKLVSDALYCNKLDRLYKYYDQR